MLVSLSYRPRGSFIEKLDPRARWIYSFCFLAAIIQFCDFRFLLFFLFLAVYQYAASKLTWRETRNAWILVIVVVSSMVIFNTLLTASGTIGSVMEGGHPVIDLQFRVPLAGWLIHFQLTVERLWFAVCQVMRIVGIALTFMVIPFTMDPRVYGVAFKGLGLPDRLAFTLDLAFRFIPTLNRDFNVTMDAQRARGYEIERVEGGLIAQVRKVAPLIVPVTMNSILIGEDVANAMDLRSFGLIKRTWIQVLQYRWYDYVLIAFSVILIIATIVIRNALGIGDFWVPAWLIPAG